MRILAFDPSKECTGFAVVDGDGTADPKLVETGTITFSEREKKEVLTWTTSLFAEVLGVIKHDLPDRVVVELPAAKNKPWSKIDKQAPLHIPTYGIAVGCVLLAVAHAMPTRDRIDTVPVDLWSKGIARGGDHKEGRVRAAAYVFGLTAEYFGCKTLAGNMADAALLARWVYLDRLRRNVA